jgi:CubicO group peptidase (beta-lactamase class C family)
MHSMTRHKTHRRVPLLACPAVLNSRWFKRTIVACAIVSSAAWAQDRFKGFDDYVREGMEEFKVPGLAIAVVKDGKVVLARAYGHRHLGQNSPVTTDTLFPIASCTKAFTACCIAMLVDEGKVQWDDPLRKHLPDFRVADPYVTENVTIRDLLCHRVGLVRGDLVGMTGAFSHAEMLNQIQYLPQASPFRSKMTYSNLMFAVLGEIVEKQSSENWEKFVTKRIFDPLEMTSTTTNRQSIDRERIATRHRFYDGELAPLRTFNSDQVRPAGAIYSTVTDMAKWLNLHLREGEHDGMRLVSTSAMREMHSLQQSIPVKWGTDSKIYDARFVGTGFGWFVKDYRGRKVIQHGGGWGSDTAFVPEENLAVVVLSNRDWNSLVWMLIFDVIDAYVVGPDQAWTKGEEWKFWLERGGPDAMERDRKTQFAELEKKRKSDTQPSLPLMQLAGIYRSTLYRDLKLTAEGRHLRAEFGRYTGALEHWENDTFYGHSVIEPFLDWLVKFDIDAQGSVTGLEIINVGWKDPDERFLFTRVSN